MISIVRAAARPAKRLQERHNVRPRKPALTPLADGAGDADAVYRLGIDLSRYSLRDRVYPAILDGVGAVPVRGECAVHLDAPARRPKPDTAELARRADRRRAVAARRQRRRDVRRAVRAVKPGSGDGGRDPGVGRAVRLADLWRPAPDPARRDRIGWWLAGRRATGRAVELAWRRELSHAGDRRAADRDADLGDWLAVFAARAAAARPADGDRDRNAGRWAVAGAGRDARGGMVAVGRERDHDEVCAGA